MRAHVERWQDGQRVACPRCGSDRYRIPSRARQVWELIMGAIVGLPLLAILVGIIYLLLTTVIPGFRAAVAVLIGYALRYPWAVALIIVVSLALWLTQDAPTERICLDCGRHWNAQR